jgi:hypothetical protein
MALSVGISDEQLAGQRSMALFWSRQTRTVFGRGERIHDSTPLGLQPGQSVKRVSQFHGTGITAFSKNCCRACRRRVSTFSLPDYRDLEYTCWPVLQTRQIARCGAA